MTAARAPSLRDSAGPMAAVQALIAGAWKQATGAPKLTALRAWAAADHEPASATPTLLIPSGLSPCKDHRADEAAADDWDTLFAAVADRLSQCIAEPISVDADLRAQVTESLQALSLLQALRAQERGKECVFEVQLRRSSDALAAAHVELAEAREGEQQASHRALHDSLTALPNRDSFSARLNQALLSDNAEKPALAVLFLDLDDFKPINDRHGHGTGDELLRVVASRLTRSVRKNDQVYRLGGDEFACILAGPQGREQVSRIASKLYDAVSAPIGVSSLQLHVRPSIGIAMCPDDGDTAAALLKRADSAMYRAKRRQLGFAFFDRNADS